MWAAMPTSRRTILPSPARSSFARTTWSWYGLESSGHGLVTGLSAPRRRLKRCLPLPLRGDAGQAGRPPRHSSLGYARRRILATAGRRPGVPLASASYRRPLPPCCLSPRKRRERSGRPIHVSGSDFPASDDVHRLAQVWQALDHGPVERGGTRRSRADDREASSCVRGRTRRRGGDHRTHGRPGDALRLCHFPTTRTTTRSVTSPKSPWSAGSGSAIDCALTERGPARLVGAGGPRAPEPGRTQPRSATGRERPARATATPPRAARSPAAWAFERGGVTRAGDPLRRRERCLSRSGAERGIPLRGIRACDAVTLDGPADDAVFGRIASRPRRLDPPALPRLPGRRDHGWRALPAHADPRADAPALIEQLTNLRRSVGSSTTACRLIQQSPSKPPGRNWSGSSVHSAGSR